MKQKLIILFLLLVIIAFLQLTAPEDLPEFVNQAKKSLIKKRLGESYRLKDFFWGITTLKVHKELFLGKYPRKHFSFRLGEKNLPCSEALRGEYLVDRTKTFFIIPIKPICEIKKIIPSVHRAFIGMEKKSLLLYAKKKFFSNASSSSYCSYKILYTIKRIKFEQNDNVCSISMHYKEEGEWKKLPFAMGTVHRLSKKKVGWCPFKPVNKNPTGYKFYQLLIISRK
jgi:hypothetical protein